MNLTQIIISLVSGGAAGAVFSFAVNRWIAAYTRKQLHAHLTIESPVWHALAVTLRVCNGYVLPLTKCWAYLTLDYKATDITRPPQGGWVAHITPDGPLLFREDRLCWSVNPNTPPVIDIYAGEKQSLLLALVPPNREWIGIFSETAAKPYRVFLRGGAKCYEGTLKIVSQDTTAKQFPIQIDLRDPEFPKNLLVAQ